MAAKELKANAGKARRASLYEQSEAKAGKNRLKQEKVALCPCRVETRF